MTATVKPTVRPTTNATSRSTAPAVRPPSTRPLWRTGLTAGLAAAAATTAVAAVAHGLGVSFETEPGQAIPAIAFGQLTLFFTAIGVLIARTIGRRARHPRSTFTRTTIILTALSIVPDVVLSAAASTKLTLAVTHVIAAAIVIPTLGSRLPHAR